MKLYKRLSSDFILSVLANIFSYFVVFCGSVIYIRILGKEEFGLYTFAFNIVSLFLLVNGFGAASGILQYVSKTEKLAEQEEYLRFAFQRGMLFNLIIGVVIIFYALYFPLPIPLAKPVLLAMAFFPVGRLYIDIFQAYLRARRQNILQAKFAIINNVVLLIANVVGILYFHLYGLIYATYIGYVGMFIYSNWKFNLPSVLNLKSFVYVKQRDFISFSFFSTLANVFSGLLFVLDIIIIGYLIKDPNLVATYRVATVIPFAINIIPMMIINFYYPEFAKNSHDPVKIRVLAKWIRRRMLVFSSIVSLILIILAKPLIYIIFGKSYQDSIIPFQIISFGYWIIASFRTINGNILAALGKARLSFYLTFFILIVNVCITYIMVKFYSINGAASAIVIVYGFSSFIGYVALEMVLCQQEH